MSKFMISAKLHELKEQFYKKNFLLNYQLSSKNLVIVFFILISVVGLLYLVQINALATKGYKIKELEERVSDLRDKNKGLELQITELRSSERISREVENLEMVAVSRVEYLRANGTSVAINR